jgi:hypothetical protein
MAAVSNIPPALVVCHHQDDIWSRRLISLDNTAVRTDACNNNRQDRTSSKRTTHRASAFSLADWRQRLN